MGEKIHIPDLIRSIHEEAPGALPIDSYAVPDNYLAELPERILARVDTVAEEEVLPLSPASNPYKIPAGYFDSIGAQIVNKTKRPDGSVKPLGRWKRLAIAASFMLVGGVGLLFYISIFSGSKDSLVMAPALEKMESSELAGFLQDESETSLGTIHRKKASDDSQLFQGISNQELESFLNENSSDENETFFN